MEPVKVDAGNAITWFSEGWQIFKSNPGVWVVMTILLMIASVVLNLIPLLGSLALMLVTPALAGGLYFAANETLHDQPVEIAHLFVGLTDDEYRTPLLVLGAIFVGISIGAFFLLMLLAGGTIGFSLFTGGMAHHNNMAAMGAFGAGMIVSMLIGMLVALTLASLMIYAIPLVLFDDIKPGEALKNSVKACLGNMLPLLVFSVIYFVLSILAMIPFGLGFFVLMPVTTAALMVSFRDIYPDSQTATRVIENIENIEIKD